MLEDKGKILLKKYLDGAANSEEEAIVESWQLNFSLTNRPALEDEEALTDLTEIREQLIRISDGRKKIKLWPRIAVAAALILICAGAYFFSASQNNQQLALDAAANHILPGKNKAVLTLANGRQIILSDATNGVLVKEAGLSIEKTKDGQLVYTIQDSHISGTKTAVADKYNMITTPRGGQYQVNLPDGTKVWLNSASSLKFPSSFSALKQRKVELNGEGYFEVEKDKAHPFMVQTATQEVEVLGTHFNISSYTDEKNTCTTLLEGAVQVSAKQGDIVNLKPNQQAVLTGKSIKVSPANVDIAVAWKNGYFKFKSESIQAVMQELSRWYDVDIVYEGEISKDHFGGKISRDKSIAEVLEMLELTKLVKFKIEGRKVIVR